LPSSSRLSEFFYCAVDPEDEGTKIAESLGNFPLTDTQRHIVENFCLQPNRHKNLQYSNSVPILCVSMFGQLAVANPPV
jgi:hypothetical protein